MTDTDCDDNDFDIKPGVIEVCDYVDNNCDGLTDNGFTDQCTFNGITNCQNSIECTAYTADTCPIGYGCVGSSVSDASWYCGVSDSDSSVGLCCRSGFGPVQQIVSGSWSCEENDPCYPEPTYSCGSEYDTDFASWLTDVSCVDPSNGLACCSVVQFGSLEYYSDTGNVKIY